MSDSSSSHTSDRYLNTPEKMKVDDLKKRVHTAEASVKRLKEKIRKSTEDHGDTIDSELHSDLLGIICTLMMSRSRGPTQKEALADYSGRNN